MKKIFSWVWDNILFLESLFLLAFIPLYPKIPVLDIQNTWVYVRIEDFIVSFILLSWLTLLVKKKITLKTPLTFPVLIFWIVGSVATLHGVLIVFPNLPNVFPNVAFLSLLRHIEYVSLFFIGYHGLRNKKLLPYVVGALTVILLAVIAYGFGQKYLGFPAFLTGNEEFAKGIPIRLSELSRVPSTFAGHYDLAAYLVLIVPIMLSLFFGLKNILFRLFFLGVTLLGTALMFMTVSRVSFVALFVSFFAVLFFMRRKIFFVALPLAFIFGTILLSYQPSLLDRFKSTVSEVDVIVDSRTGESVGHVKFVEKEYLSDKLILQRRVKDSVELANVMATIDQDEQYSLNSPVFPFRLVPEEVPLVTAVNISTGESLPSGTGYINLSLSPVTKRLNNFFYELPKEEGSTLSAQVIVFHGPFIVKRAAAYDLSFTTRFQGEWPNAINAFKKNIFLGSGYGGVGLAIDNNYLRILGETGILGFSAFFSLFLILAIYIRKIYPSVDSSLAKSFIIGFTAGLFGLFLNATLIDIFEASKIAFVLWLLVGIVFALLIQYQKKTIDILSELRSSISSPFVIIAILAVLTGVIFSPAINNFFVGDDFTWFRWAAECGANCQPAREILNYFTSSDGFFYRPGAKTYFLLMYKTFWLNQSVYHMVSILLHFVVASLMFLLSWKIFKNVFLAAAASFVFLILSGATEAVFWISTTGYLFNTVFGLLGILLFILWDDRRKLYFLGGSIFSISLSFLFHELGIVYPFLVLVYALLYGKDTNTGNFFRRWDLAIVFSTIPIYLVIRFLSGSHWFSGDYSYNLLKLPLNVIGNSLGYLVLTLLGPITLPVYTLLRETLRENLIVAVTIIPVAAFVLFIVYKYSIKIFDLREKKIVLFGILFFAVSLIPFLGLGNISSRYSYLASFGIVIILIVFAKKFFAYLAQMDRKIASLVISLFVIIFVLFHVISLQQSYFNWNEAGTKTKKFFLSIDAQYSNLWVSPNTQFHFVNVPIKVGEAWVFPVGLTDALWFAIQNENAKIFVHSDVGEAISASEGRLDLDRPVLIFQPDGSLITPYAATVSSDLINQP